LEHGTGGINIDECRVKPTDDVSGWSKTGSKESENTSMSGKNYNREPKPDNPQGRFPANFIHDGSGEVVSQFPDTKSGKMTAEHNRSTNGSPNGIYGKFDVEHPLSETYGDSGSAARFFYCAKASKKDRNEGLEEFEVKEAPVKDFRPTLRDEDSNWETPIQETPYGGANRAGNTQNNHPTVKPTKLMQYLVRLVTPKRGTVLDPFMGSGSTGKACAKEGFDFIGIDLDPEYVKIAQARIDNELPN